MLSPMWSRFAAICLLFVGAAVLVVSISRHNDVQEPYAITLPQFNGRVLPLEKIKPGTFTVNEDFEGVSQWGQDGILVYEGKIQKVSLKAWRPDPKTAGVFQYAEKEFSVLEHWTPHHKVDKVEMKSGVLWVYPCIHSEALMPGYVIALVLLVVGLCLTPVGTLFKKLLSP